MKKFQDKWTTSKINRKKYETFKQAITGNIIGNKTIIGKGKDNIDQIFDAYWAGRARPLFEEENRLTKAFIDNMEKEKLKNYLNYTPFPKKKRTFKYSTDPVSDALKKKTQENMIKGLGATTNANTNQTTWNDINGNYPGNNSTNGYISKAKLN